MFNIRDRKLNFISGDFFFLFEFDHSIVENVEVCPNVRQSLICHVDHIVSIFLLDNEFPYLILIRYFTLNIKNNKQYGEMKIYRKAT